MGWVIITAMQTIVYNAYPKDTILDMIMLQLPWEKPMDSYSSSTSGTEKFKNVCITFKDPSEKSEK